MIRGCRRGNRPSSPPRCRLRARPIRCCCGSTRSPAMASPRIALVTARAARGSDGDMPPLLSALHDAGTDAQELDWDDDAIDWSRFDLALLRSTWDYCERLPAFLAWAERVAAQTRLLNPLPVIRWNTDKHYLADLARAGVPVVPGAFVEPDD